MKKEATKQRSEKDRATPSWRKTVWNPEVCCQTRGRAVVPFQPRRLPLIRLLSYLSKRKIRMAGAYRGYPLGRRTKRRTGGKIQPCYTAYNQCGATYTATWGWHAEMESVALCAHSFTMQSPNPVGFSPCALSFQALHKVTSKYSTGTAKHNFTSLFSWKTFSWVKKMFHLVSNQLLRCKPAQTTSMHADSLTTADVLQLAVQRNRTEMKGRSCQIFVIHN